MRTASHLGLTALLACLAIAACSQKPTAAAPNGASAAQPGAAPGQPLGQGTGDGGGFRQRGTGGMDETTFVERFRRRIMRADANGDGRVTESEWLAWKRTRPNAGRGDPAHRFKVLDMNGDGVLTADELTARGERAYAKRARNGDLGVGGGMNGRGGGRGGQDGGMNGRGGGGGGGGGDQDDDQD